MFRSLEREREREGGTEGERDLYVTIILQSTFV